MGEKDYIWNAVTCSYKNGKYLASIINNSLITHDEIINAKTKLCDKETKTVLINFHKKVTKCFYILLTFINYN